MKKILIHLVIISLFLCNVEMTTASEVISFHLVEENCTKCALDQYTPGPKVFHDYKFHWLNEQFFIKKASEFTISPNEITSILIKKEINDVSYHKITIFLEKEASERLQNYTTNSLGTKNTVQLGSTILTLATIHFVLEKKFTFAMRNQTDEEVAKIFNDLSEKIEME